MKEQNYMFIVRDYKKQHWTLQVGVNDKLIFKHAFTDKEHNQSDKAALDAAIATRNDIAKEFGIDLKKHQRTHSGVFYRRRYIHNTLSNRNTTGTVGVAYIKSKQVWYYRATIYFESGISTTKNFSCAILGRKKAKKLAIKQRKQWEDVLLST